MEVKEEELSIVAGCCDWCRKIWNGPDNGDWNNSKSSIQSNSSASSTCDDERKQQPDQERMRKIEAFQRKQRELETTREDELSAHLLLHSPVRRILSFVSVGPTLLIVP